MFFSYQQIQSLNDTESTVFDYVTRNPEEVMKLNIRELSDRTFVSTATIIRFCKKMDCDGYSEFKTKLKMLYEQQMDFDHDNEIRVLQDFFSHATSDEFQQTITDAVELLKNSEITFLGIGTSGTLGEYGARMFSNYGVFATSIKDPYYPPRVGNENRHVLIVLSESGETREVIDQVRLYRQLGSKILTITNHPHSTIDKMADGGIYYFVKDVVLPQTYNISTQVPVVYILETLARELSKVENKKMPAVTSTRNEG